MPRETLHTDHSAVLRSLESTLETVAMARRYHQWLAELVSPLIVPPVLEIGAGRGTFSAALSNRVTSVLASEPDPRLESLLRNRFQHDPRVRVVPPVSLPLERPLGEGPVPRTIVLANVIEHISDDVAALASLRHGVPGLGALVIIVPAHSWAYGPLDRALGHHRRYTLSGLRSTLEESGWASHVLRYVNPLGAIAWAVSGRLFGRSTISSTQTRVVELSMPLIRAADRLLGGQLMGQSIVAMATPASLRTDQSIHVPRPGGG